MNAQIYPFPKNPEMPVAPTELTDKIESPQTFESVKRAICQLCRFFEYEPVPIYKIGVISDPDPTEFGEVKHVKFKKEEAIVVSSEFPRSLQEKKGLLREEALELSANFVYTFGLIYGALAVRRERITRDTGKEMPLLPFEASLNSKLWEGAYKQSGVLAIPYRMAGTVALTAAKYEPLEFPVPSPLPPHIAALANPFSRMEFAKLHSVLK